MTPTDLRDMLNSAGWTQRQLAEHPELQCNIRTVQRYLSGDITIRPRIAAILRRILGGEK